MVQKKRGSAYFLKYIVLILGLSVVIGVFYHNKVHPPVVCVVDGVQDYDAALDKQQIKDLFNADHYWLTVNDDYDIDHMLDTNSPNRYENRYIGVMPIKVIRDNDQVAAWTAYYMRSIYEGKILFVDVNSAYRKKGLARKLIQYAECDLRRRGAYKVTLATRTSNKAAQIAYEKMDYVKTGDWDGFVHYEKRLKN